VIWNSITNDSLVFSGTPLVVGTTFLGVLDGFDFCLTYVRNDSNLSANANVTQIKAMYGNCVDCEVAFTPTPTVTPTVTPTPSITPTLTPTPSSTNVAWTYVFQSCTQNSFGYPQTTVLQTSFVEFALTPTKSFKDSEGNCWVYVGQFQSYYPVGNTNIVNFNGDYFSGLQTVVYQDCESCNTTTPGNTQLACITYTDENFGSNLPDQCGGYSGTSNKVTVFLTNNNIPVAAIQNVQVTFELERTDCLGNETEDFTVTILQGQTSGSKTYISSTCEYCQVTSLPNTVTKSILTIKSITPSTITEC